MVTAADHEYRHVRVTGGKSWPSGYDWGLFMYCEQAVATDIARGFDVEIWDKHTYGDYGPLTEAK